MILSNTKVGIRARGEFQSQFEFGTKSKVFAILQEHIPHKNGGIIKILETYLANAQVTLVSISQKNQLKKIENVFLLSLLIIVISPL